MAKKNKSEVNFTVTLHSEQRMALDEERFRRMRREGRLPTLRRLLNEAVDEYLHSHKRNRAAVSARSGTPTVSSGGQP